MRVCNQPPRPATPGYPHRSAGAGHRAAHAQRQVPAVGRSPRSRPRPCPGGGLGGEVLQAPQLELQGRVPGLDHNVVPCRQPRLITSFVHPRSTSLSVIRPALGSRTPSRLLEAPSCS
jgi:hypothetical protein